MNSSLIGKIEKAKRYAREKDRFHFQSFSVMVSGDNGPQFGAPTVSGAKVVAKIVSQGKGKKINGFTFKPKKNVHRRYGHRQHETKLRIESIEV